MSLIGALYFGYRFGIALGFTLLELLGDGLLFSQVLLSLGFEFLHLSGKSVFQFLYLTLKSCLLIVHLLLIGSLLVVQLSLTTLGLILQGLGGLRFQGYNLLLVVLLLNAQLVEIVVGIGLLHIALRGQRHDRIDFLS